MQQGKEVICPKNKPLSASSEDYLKAVYYCSQSTNNVRSADIAAYLGVTKPSVHHAMAVLQDAGLIIKPLYGEVSLTEYGRRRAQIVIWKYNLLKELLVSLQVDEATAEQDACRMEHLVSDETLSHLLHHFDQGRTYKNNLRCPACWDENARKCILAQDGKCLAC